MKNYVLYLLPLLLVFGCTQSRESAEKQVKDAEAALYGSNGAYQFNDSLATITVDAYLNFADNFKDDSLAAEYLFKAGDLYRSQHKFKDALEVYHRIRTEHPDYDKVPQALFLEGFVLENDLKDLDQAKERYQEFLKLYPDHVLAKDVQFSLNNLGRSPEDIIREFNQNQTTDSTAVDSTTSL